MAIQPPHSLKLTLAITFMFIKSKEIGLSIPEQFLNQKYVNLETFKKDGSGVKTPVWFVTENDYIYVVTRSKTGKVKRLRNNSSVRICPCTFNGTPKGEWHTGTATMVEGDEVERIIKMRKKKYGIQARLIGMLTKNKGEFVVYAIRLNHSVA